MNGLLEVDAATTDVEQVVERAQRIVDQHAILMASGKCSHCGTPGPCDQRWLALRELARNKRLPRRAPGLSRPELVGARRIDAPAGRIAVGARP